MQTGTGRSAKDQTPEEYVEEVRDRMDRLNETLMKFKNIATPDQGRNVRVSLVQTVQYSTVPVLNTYICDRSIPSAAVSTACSLN
jgi:hypothetical protein